MLTSVLASLVARLALAPRLASSISAGSLLARPLASARKLAAAGGALRSGWGLCIDFELAGQDVSRLPPYDRPVNTVFQDYALFPHMTVQQNVEYGLMVKKVRKGERRERAEAALEMVRLAGYGKRKDTKRAIVTLAAGSKPIDLFGAPA